MTVTQNKFSSQSFGTCDEPKVEIIQYDDYLHSYGHDAPSNIRYLLAGR